MFRTNGELVFSPSDLCTFWDSEFASWMDRHAIEGHSDGAEPDPDDPLSVVLQGRGLTHEQAILDSLKKKHLNIVEIISPRDRVASFDETLSALRSGADVIYQARLESPPFSGLADFLVRVEGPSALGHFHYQIWDTKLSGRIKPYFLIQLCAYADYLAKIQGCLPQEVAIILGSGERRAFRTIDYFYYYKMLKQKFIGFHANYDARRVADPARCKSFGRWSNHAEEMLKKQDSLVQVARITQSQIRKLLAQEITTMRELACTNMAHIPKLKDDIFTRLRHQAKLQDKSRGCEIPLFNVLPHEPTRRLGLHTLPPASSHDVFFDMEGFPLISEGLEYLWGAAYLDGHKNCFRVFWAHNRDEERLAFEGFIDWVHGLWKHDPSMHIYHYASYEVTAVRRLMGRFGSREQKVDELLRHEVFVDLYQIVRNALRVGGRNYSIKTIERLYRNSRTVDVKDAGTSVVYYEMWLQNRDQAVLDAICDYNRDDCNSTRELCDWLRNLQVEHQLTYIAKAASATEDPASKQATSKATSKDCAFDVGTPKGIVVDVANPKEVTITEPAPKPDALSEVDAIRSRLLAMSQTYPEFDTLAWLLDFHRRELKPMWWRYFDRLKMGEEELYEDIECLAGLVRTDAPAELVGRSYVYDYRFDPAQECKLTPATQCVSVQDANLRLTLHAIDTKLGLCKIKAGVKTAELPSKMSLIPLEYINPAILEAAVRRYIDARLSGGTTLGAIDDFLARRRPRLRGRESGPVLVPQPGTDILKATIDSVLRLENSTLCIQGPPGAGKTYLAAHIIEHLISLGHRVGISSNSHKAINHLLKAAQERIGEAKLCGRLTNSCRTIKIGGDADDPIFACGVEFVKSVKDLGHLAVSNGPMLIGGTAYAFANETMAGCLDYLFVDEAGQVCVANLVAMGAATRNIVLMGDQMQLGQPVQGSHPGKSGLSSLDYLLEGRATIDAKLGVFLPNTYRLNPNICAFISEMVYDSRLASAPGLENQRILTTKPRSILSQPIPATAMHVHANGVFSTLAHSTRADSLPTQGAGIVFYPVEHEGNSQASDEEVVAIQQIFNELMECVFIDKQNNKRPMTAIDILIVAPFNYQVRKLQSALGPTARVGSVDKFQGQEAPVVIVSMCASSTDNQSARGIEFLFNRQRLNVALSRAQALAIIVASPALMNGYAATVVQMAQMNFFCRLIDFTQTQNMTTK